jgi:hypothetical protein
MTLSPPTRSSWWRRGLRRLAQGIRRRQTPPVLGRLRAPELVIHHERADDIRAWAARYLPCSFTATDGFVHVVTRITVTGDATGIRVRLDFGRSWWTNAEDERLAWSLAQRTALAIATWIGASTLWQSEGQA